MNYPLHTAVKSFTPTIGNAFVTSLKWNRNWQQCYTDVTPQCSHLRLPELASIHLALEYEMASIHRDKRTGNWIIMFRWDGAQIRRSCGTTSESQAESVKQRVEDTIRLLKLGRMVIPNNADAGIWILSEGRVSQRQTHDGKQLTLFHEICKAYLPDQKAKEENTLRTESTHIKHLIRVFGRRKRLSGIVLADIQRYVNKRHSSEFGDRAVEGETIRRELTTFRQIWNWAKKRHYVTKNCPVYDEDCKWAVSIPKSKEKTKFQTWSQITRQISLGGLSDDEQKELWKSLFLDEDQVVELLDHVALSARYEFIYPMFAFTAYTGARRSEICRSRIGDFDFDTGQITIRERKRCKKKSESQRCVPMHPKLRSVMLDWFDQHPGGQYTITAPLKMRGRKPRKTVRQTTVSQADCHFDKALEGSKWEVIRGFHVLRHSFGSNLARSGRVPRDVIASWMGHTTEEMIKLYQHLFPQDGPEQISVLK